MATLNFKHLRYFWMVAKSGGIARASERLHLTPQAISGQLTEFAQSLNAELFRRSGRGLELTDAGRRILSYAEEIFALGDELQDVLRTGATSVSVPLRVGIADSVPKLEAYRLIEPALRAEESLKLICREGRLDGLLAELAVHRLDVVLADRPMPANLNVKGFNHILGDSGVSVLGARELVRAMKGRFPRGLDGAPFLLPGEDVTMRARLERWFEDNDIRPRVVGEFDDSALLKAFGQAGAGFFVTPTTIDRRVMELYEVERVGRIDSVREQIFAITTERRLSHPAVIAISQGGQGERASRVNAPARRSGQARTAAR
jgi:LysR family transcriptional activator of nhaA